jgi:hypothetical protein
MIVVKGCEMELMRVVKGCEMELMRMEWVMDVI